MSLYSLAVALVLVLFTHASVSLNASEGLLNLLAFSSPRHGLGRAHSDNFAFGVEGQKNTTPKCRFTFSQGIIHFLEITYPPLLHFGGLECARSEYSVEDDLYSYYEATKGAPM